MQQAIEIIKNSKQGQPITAERMFIGKTMEKDSGVFIQDEMGTDRLKIYVDDKNNPRIEILDEIGNVIKNLVSDY